MLYTFVHINEKAAPESIKVLNISLHVLLLLGNQI